jgi:hypothetical protein
MPDNLTTYLHDHLAGARFATALLADLEAQNLDDQLARFASTLLSEIEEDKSALEGVLARLESRPSVIKEASAWLSQKVGRVKFQLDSEPFSIFEALEVLSLGILGKLALWNALRLLPTEHDAVQGLDLQHMADRATRQHAEVERRRLHYAELVLKQPS